MFELEIEQLKKFLIAQLPQAQPYVFLRDILSQDAIAESYKRFFTGEVDWWLYEEQNQWLDHHRFDTSAPEFTPIFKQLDDAFRQNAHFDHDVLLSTIDAAAKVRLNFLCRPRTTLKWFVYRGGPTKTIYEILLRLEYLADYSYLTKGFYAWARKTYSHYPAMDLLSVVEFQKIIETIDNEYILDLSPHQFVDLLVPLFEFFNPHVKDSSTWTVPTEALIVFLDDKKVELIAKELERMLYEDNLEQVSQEQFLELVIEILTLVESGELIPDFQVIDFEGDNEDDEIPEDALSEEYPESEHIEVVSEVEHGEEVPEDEQVQDIAEYNEEIRESEHIDELFEVEQIDEVPNAEHDTEGREAEFWEVVPTIDIADEIVGEIPDAEIPDESAPEIAEAEFWEVVPPIEVADEIVGEIPDTEIPDESVPEIAEAEFWEVVPPIEVAEEIVGEIPDTEIQDESAPEIAEAEFWEVVPPIEVAEEMVGEIPDTEIPDESAPEIAEAEFWEVVPPIEVAEEMVGEIPDTEIPDESAPEIADAEFWEVVPPIEVAEEIVGEIPDAEIPDDSAPEIAEAEFWEVVPPIEVAEEMVDENHTQEVAEIRDHEEQPALPRWETIIDSKLKDKFVKKLFDSNEVVYHKLLGELDDCPSWAKADAAIVRYFIRAKKKHTDSIAVEFGRTIQKRYIENQ